MSQDSGVRRYAARAVALAVVAGLYGAGRLPAFSRSERREAAARFHFVRLSLPEPAVRAAVRTVRPVHPSLEHISAWISSVGAGVALSDLDGDGLSNDACYVDPRTDEVVVARLPETGARARDYAPFALGAGPLFSRDTMAPMGCLPVDLDEDGRMDLIVYYWGRTPILFLRSAVPGGPAFSPRELVSPPQRWFSNAATAADLDGDGHLDLVIGNYFPDGSRILDAADRGGPAQQMQDSMSRAFNGGSKRFLLCVPAAGGVECRDTPAALDARVSHGWTLAAGAADLDHDLLPEVYLANDFGPDRLLHNRSRPGELRLVALRGRRGLTTPGSKVLGRDSFKGMGVDFGDVNGDGVFDIYVSNIATTYALEESHLLFEGTGRIDLMHKGEAPYRERSEPMGLSRSGWAWDARLADFDNDGRLEAVQALGFITGEADRWPELHELAMGNDTLVHRVGAWPRFQPGDGLHGGGGVAFFARGDGERFEDLAADVGFEAHDVTRGLAVADVDGDGDLDLATANQWGPSALYRNDPVRPASSLVLRLLLPAAGALAEATEIRTGHEPPTYPTRPAVGAMATVMLPAVASAGPAPPRRLVGQVDGGNGHSGKRGPELHFGVGRLATTARLRVELRWRDGEGRVREEVHWMSPGWHTVVLASGRPDRRSAGLAAQPAPSGREERP